ncbi:hypothetical protein B9Z55_020602 [Caenorhabditis nigoni]|uniref:SXP/RAL-2 family protein Ani s 5-like cation-binding domain-containing protein n=1 Tax=Caenorhabditis nigoni TaxID=1611254 RepID=A0A2G5TNI5_9PELO|nr:hypothetical protein B9Z55_020602 [Caenorhabditis nigoni]
MFNLFYILFFSFAISAFAAPLTEKEANAELLASGMTQASIDGLDALSKKFATGFPLVKSDKEATDIFIADFRSESENYVKSMPANDQTIYSDYLKKHDLA